jgi:hypothetical protein
MSPKRRLSVGIVPAVSLLVLAAVWAFREIYSPDLGFHLKAGRWILSTLRIPGQDIFTYTVTGRPYIDLYWIFQAILALADKAGGEPGIVALNALLVSCSVGLLLYRMRRYGALEEHPAWPLWGLLAVAAMAALFEVRPHTFSWIYLNLTLLILEEYRRGNRRWIRLLPLLTLLWVNTHTLFILGWVAVGAFAATEIIDRRSFRSPLLGVLGLSILAAFVNPYGWNGVFLPFQQFQFLQPSNIFKSTIAEYQTPLSLSGYVVNGSFVLFQPLFAFHVLLVVSLVVLVMTARRRPLVDTILYVLFLYVAIAGIKNIGYAVVAVVPMLAAGPLRTDEEPPDGLARLVRSASRLLSGRAVAIGTSIIACLLIWGIATNRYYVNFRSNDRFGYRTNPLVLPLNAATFINANHLTGRVLNHFNEGGYLMLALNRPVAIDGRNELIGEEFYASWSALWNFPEKSAILTRFDPDIVVVPHFYEPTWISWFARNPAWRLVYFDHLSAVYLRPGYAPDIPSMDPLHWLTGQPIVPPEGVDALLLQPDPNDLAAALFGRVRYPQVWIGLASFAFHEDWLEAAVQYGMRGVRETSVPAPELFYNLGNVFFEGRQWSRADFCYRRFLLTGDDPIARERVQWMKLRGLAPEADHGI